MYKIFTIRPKLEKNVYFSTSKEYQVIFQWNGLPLNGHYQQSTVCIIRDGITVVGLGCTIRNPHDAEDTFIGQQTAFRRAVGSLYNHVSFDYGVNWGDAYLKREKRAWRVALREARITKENEESS